MDATAFDFDRLDELTLALEQGDDVTDLAGGSRFDRLGPFVEFWYALGRRAEALRLAGFTTGSFIAALDSGLSMWLCPTTCRRGFLRVGGGADELVREEDTTLLTKFLLDFKRAAETTGMHSDLARKLQIVIQEWRNNVLEHSGAPETSLIAFAVGQHGVEFAVADAGRGVLAELRSHPDYAHLRDDAEALETALQPGVTSKRDGNGGLGFTDLFNTLMRYELEVRFHSGDAVVSGRGRGTTLSTLDRRQAARLGGFIAWVGTPQRA